MTSPLPPNVSPLASPPLIAEAWSSLKAEIALTGAQDCIGTEFWKISESASLFPKAQRLCEIESLSFLNEENHAELCLLQKEFEHLGKNSNWRILMSLWVTQVEWMNDVSFLSLSDKKRQQVLTESPIKTWASLMRPQPQGSDPTAKQSKGGDFP